MNYVLLLSGFPMGRYNHMFGRGEAKERASGTRQVISREAWELIPSWHSWRLEEVSREMRSTRSRKSCLVRRDSQESLLGWTTSDKEESLLGGVHLQSTNQVDEILTTFVLYDQLTKMIRALGIWKAKDLVRQVCNAIFQFHLST